MSTHQGRKMNPSKFHVSQLKFYIYLIPLCLFTGLPIIFIFAHAFKPIDELFAFPPRFFVINPTLDNFRNILNSSTNGIPISRYLFNSILVSSLVVFLSIILSTLAGYSLSKLNFKFKKIIFEINTIALMFVGVVLAIPRYFIVNQLGLIDSFYVHIVPLLAIPVGLFLVKQFIDQIPNELIEASRVDGASNFYIYRHIILPLIKPAISTVAILSFQVAWNNIDTSNIFINSDSKRTLAFYLSTLASNNSSSIAGQGMAAASALIMFIPNLIFFIIMQRQVMATMAHSGIK